MDESENGQANLKEMRKNLGEHPVEVVGEKLRAMMPWIASNKMVDKKRN